MRAARIGIAVGVLVGLQLGAAPVHAAESTRLAHGVIVKLKSASGVAARAGHESALAAEQRLQRVFSEMPLALGHVRPTGTHAYWVQWARPLDADEAQRLVDALKQHAEVAWAAPNVYEQRLQAPAAAAAAVPNDPDYAAQWWLSASASAASAGSRGVPAIADAWSTSTGRSVNVAVLDTGLRRDDPDLAGTRFDTGYDVATDDGREPSGDGDGRDADFDDPGDGRTSDECADVPDAAASSWHGTTVAGIVGATTDNAIGVAGINRRARVISVRVAGPCGALVTDITDGMRWAAGLAVSGLPQNPHPARIVNLSFGSANEDCQAYQETIDELHQAGVLVVAAAGNDDGIVDRPARCPGVLAVGAVERDGSKTSYANLGAEIGVATVGGAFGIDGGLVSTTNDGQLAPGNATYDAVQGTSFSTPIVSGVASLMLSVNPDLTVDQLVAGLRGTARPFVDSAGLPACQSGVAQGRCNCTTATCGTGLLDAPGALAYAVTPPVTPEPPANDGGDEGGGAFGIGWLIALALAACAVARAPLRHETRRELDRQASAIE